MTLFLVVVMASQRSGVKRGTLDDFMMETKIDSDRLTKSCLFVCLFVCLFWFCLFCLFVFLDNEKQKTLFDLWHSFKSGGKNSSMSGSNDVPSVSDAVLINSLAVDDKIVLSLKIFFLFFLFFIFIFLFFFVLLWDLNTNWICDWFWQRP